MRKRLIRSLLLVAISVPVALLGITDNAEAYTATYVLDQSDFVDKTISISTTGRYVAFLSDESDLDPQDLNNFRDAFIKDTETGTVSLLSITPSGTSGNNHTNGTPIITGNGRFVLFGSEATNLSSTPGGSYASNVYLRDLKTSTTYLIAKSQDGSGLKQYPYGLSEDGRFVYYMHRKSGETPRLLMLDRILNTTTRVDVNDNGDPSNSGFQGASSFARRQVSCDGRFVVMASESSNLVGDDGNNFPDIFLIDMMNGHSIKNITAGSNGINYEPTMTCDGNYILFQSDASNLVNSDTNGVVDIFRYDVSQDTLERVSVKDDESEYDGVATSEGSALAGKNYEVSMDGRYIFFIHRASSTSLMLRDTKDGTTSKILGGYAWNPIVSYDGRKLYYIATSNSSWTLPRIRQVTNYLN